MAHSAPAPLRKLLEERLGQLIADAGGLFAEARQQAGREVADQLNQAARLLRKSSNLEDLCATLVESTAAFCPAAAFFALRGEMLAGKRIRGIPEGAATDFATFELPLSSAPALASAAASRDPVVTATAAPEVSEELAGLLGHDPEGRASIYPVLARERVVGLLYVWGAVQGPAIELLAQVASSEWVALAEAAALPAEPASALVTIAPVAAEPQPVGRKEADSWDRLTPEDQRIHLRAQRFARVQVSEMRLFEPDAVQRGRTNRDLYYALGAQIDAARETYRASFFAPCPSMLDYLHLELVRTLANDNPELLGRGYPGPMV